MREIAYNTFSLRAHRKNWRLLKTNTCQFELTFGCDLHCRHCYSDCYNKPEYIKKELAIREIKLILDKLYKAGTIWLCFTGGDPLTRADFLEIYKYAKDKGFIITIFTNGFSMTEGIAAYLKKHPPFAIELTLNSSISNIYDRISLVDGSFHETMRGINIILKAGLALKVKTQIIRDNLKEVPKIENLLKKIGLKLRPNFNLHARLDGDLAPCSLRVKPKEALNFFKKRNKGAINPGLISQVKGIRSQMGLFSCAIGSKDEIMIDPYGNLIPCSCIRRPKVNLLKNEIWEAQKEVLNWLETKKRNSNYDCRGCSLRSLCGNCPGYTFLEERDLRGKIGWFCRLTHLAAQGN